MSTGNNPHLSWPLDRGERGREVWYSLVTHPKKRLAFWYRYTLLSTDSGHQEVRLWAVLTDLERGGFFVTRRYPLDQLGITHPLELTVDGSELTSQSAVGRIELDETDALDAEGVSVPATEIGDSTGLGDADRINWDLTYRPDEVTFTPLRSKKFTDFAVKFLGSGRHWSFNQSVEMNGTLEFGDRTIEFEDAPGHQGHTVGRTAPDSWSWLHCNSFEENIVIETLNVEGKTSICFRRGNQTYFLNRLHHIFLRNKTAVNKPGKWRFSGSGGGLDLEVEVEVDPATWKFASYLTPDDTTRYVAHSSLSNVKVTYEIDGEERTAQTDDGRSEWAGREPRVAGEYSPVELQRD